ncbi:outer membrane protein [Hydrogenophaga sp.]|uniref:outer membrane protein n=1 Tax=Hydrogenophaga sp. TaxID=1904254 RepID=UPI003F6B4A50
MKLKHLAVPALIALSSSAFAGGFDGPSLQAGISLSVAQTSLKDYSPDGKVSDNAAVGNLSLNYSKSFGKFNLGGGVFSMLGTQNSGSLQSFAEDDPVNQVGGTGGLWSDRFDLKNVWGISVEPGLNLNESTLVYAKFSYVRAKGTNVYNYPQDADQLGSASRNHSGMGVGAGVKFKLSDNLYGMVEVEQVNFNTKSYYTDATETYKPRLVKGTIGIGYRF